MTNSDFKGKQLICPDFTRSASERTPRWGVPKHTCVYLDRFLRE